MENSSVLLHIHNIQKYYGSNNSNIVKALDDISFDVQKGEFLGIMGSSGAGKSTLLNCISTIDSVSAGKIILDGKEVNLLKDKMLARFRRENLGFIFQDFSLLDNLTIYDNIALALTINNVPTDVIKKKVEHVAKQLGIYEILQHYPYETSGGQKQRCACARAIINEPRNLCVGACPNENLVNAGTTQKSDSKNCRFIQAMYNDLIHAYLELTVENKKQLLG